MLVRPARRVRAGPGPLADQGDVTRDRADPRHRHPVTEVRGVERAGDVRDPRARGGIRAVKRVVVPRRQPLADPGHGLAGDTRAPFGQCGQVIVHPDDADARARGRPQPGQDVRQVADRLRQARPGAARDAADARHAAAVFRVVGADVDSDQEDVAAMGGQEGGRGGQLGTAGIVADPATDHRAGRLAGAAELHQPQRGLAAVQHRVQLIGVALGGLDAGPRGVGLDPLGQRVAERQVVASRSRRGRRPRRRAAPGAGRDRRRHGDGQGERDADRAHASLFSKSTIGPRSVLNIYSLRAPRTLAYLLRSSARRSGAAVHRRTDLAVASRAPWRDTAGCSRIRVPPRQGPMRPSPAKHAALADGRRGTAQAVHARPAVPRLGAWSAGPRPYPSRSTRSREGLRLHDHLGRAEGCARSFCSPSTRG